MGQRRGNRWIAWLLLGLVVAGAWMAWPRPAPQAIGERAGDGAPSPTVAAAPAPPVHVPPVRPQADLAAPLPGFLPAETARTIALIRRGGPFPHRQDGSVFRNREGHLPRKPRGWYREYTVDTPGLTHRGARRIITGGDPPREWYYTGDHYDSFRRFEIEEPR